MKTTTTRYLLTLLFLGLSCAINAQLYRGIAAVKPFEKELAELDMYLQLNPNKCETIYQELLPIADKKHNLTLKAVLHIYKGTLNYYVGKRDSARIYFEKAIALADKIPSNQLRSTARIRKLFVIADNTNSKIMLSLMEDEYEIAREHHDTINMIYSLNGMAMSYQNQDKTEPCVNTYMKAIRLAQESGNEFEYGFLLNNLGLVKLRLKSTDDAYGDFTKGLSIARKLNNVRLELTLKENLGYYYMEIDSVNLAEKQYREALNLASDLNYAYLAFNSIVNLGVLERTRGNYARSDSLLDKALQMGRKNKLYYAIAPIFLTLAQIELYRNNYNKVSPLLDSAMNYAAFTSKNDIQEGVLVVTQKMYEQQNDFKNALRYQKELEAFRDSVDKSGQMEIVKELHLKYDVEREEKKRIKERIALEKQINHEKLNSARLRQNVGFGIIVFIIMLGALVIYYFREKHKRESQFSSALVNKLEEERGRIARDLHDGLGQSLVILKNKFNKLSYNDQAATTQINDDFAQTIEDVRMISRSLIPPELRRLGLMKALQKMMKDVESSSDIVITTDLEYLKEIELSESQEIRIYRIIQELTNNTIKHSEATSMKVEFMGKGNELKIVYQDNGKGISTETFNSPENTVGLRSIEQRLKFLNGTIKFEKPSKGVRIVIKIKPGVK